MSNVENRTDLRSLENKVDWETTCIYGYSQNTKPFPNHSGSISLELQKTHIFDGSCEGSVNISPRSSRIIQTVHNYLQSTLSVRQRRTEVRRSSWGTSTSIFEAYLSGACIVRFGVFSSAGKMWSFAVEWLSRIKEWYMQAQSHAKNTAFARSNEP